MQLTALKMAAPAGIKVFVLSIQKAVDLINDSRAVSMKILVLSDNPQDIYEVLKKINEKPLLNLANYGWIGSGRLSEKKKLTETVYVTNEDKEIFNKIFDMGHDFQYQPSPSDAKQSLKVLLEACSLRK
jgi:PTS system mannose-specific IIB component